MGILIKNGRLIDVSAGLDLVGDLYVDGGVIISADQNVLPHNVPEEVIDARGLIVMPGMVDMHVHLREPGLTHKEDIASGSRAAAMGGFTTVACMPNTKPVPDSVEVLSDLLARIRKTAAVRVLPIGAVTDGQQGGALAPIEALAAAGACAVSDDGRPVESAAMMRDALLAAHRAGIPVISHCEDLSLSANGVMHEGAVSARLGVPGVPAAAEEVMVARDIVLAEATHAHVHIAHVSTAGSVALVRAAKLRGVHVTCETCPHYFSLTDEAVTKHGALAKVSPPLRTAADVEAIIEGLTDGTIDVIATDHAPHHADEKARGLLLAPCGFVGLETALALSLTYLYKPGHMPLKDILYKLTAAPAAILDIDAGSLRVGAPADVTVIDPDSEWIVEPAHFASKSRNTPYAGARLTGKVRHTICAGRLVVRDGKLLV